MKYLLSTFLALLFFTCAAQAHTLFMTVSDNEDGTVTVEGMYSTGAVASRTPVRLEDSDGKVLFTGKTDADGELEIRKPDVEYTIILDAGPGHMASSPGLR